MSYFIFFIDFKLCSTIYIFRLMNYRYVCVLDKCVFRNIHYFINIKNNN